MALELIISLIALAALFCGTLLGWKNGGAAVLRYALVAFFGVLVALRYWHLAFALVTRFIPALPQGYLAAGIFIALFVLGSGVAGAVVNLKVPGFQNVFSSIPENVIGALLGLFTATLVSGVLLMAAALIIPGLSQPYDASKLLARIDRFPVVIFQTLEDKVAGVPQVSPAHTPLPSWQGGAEDGKVVWK